MKLTCNGACFAVIGDICGVVWHVYDVKVGVEVCAFLVSGSIPNRFFVMKVV